MRTAPRMGALVEGRQQIDDDAVQIAKIDFSHPPRLDANANGIGEPVRPAFKIAP